MRVSSSGSNVAHAPSATTTQPMRTKPRQRSVINPVLERDTQPVEDLAHLRGALALGLQDLELDLGLRRGALGHGCLGESRGIDPGLLERSAHRLQAALGEIWNR